MKQLTFLVLALFAAGAMAQDKPMAKEEAKPEPAVKEAAKDTGNEAAKPATATSATTQRKGPRRWNEDARHCLEKSTNTEVIKCAEEFL